MENPQSISKFSLNPGLMLGGALVFISATIYASGIDIFENTWIGWITYLVMAFTFYYYQTSYRDNQNEGFLSLGDAVKIGVTIAVIAGAITAVYNVIFANFIAPDYLDKVLLKMEEKMVEQDPNIRQEEIDLAIKMTKKVMSPYISVPLEIVGKAVSGLVLSLATGFFVKRKNPDFS